VFNTFMEQAQNQLFEEYPELQHIVLKRQLERGLGRIPKSQDDLADFAREQLESQR
jgi:hypothetical protein